MKKSVSTSHWPVRDAESQYKDKRWSSTMPESVRIVWYPVSTARQTCLSLTWQWVRIWFSCVSLLLFFSCRCVCVCKRWSSTTPESVGSVWCLVNTARQTCLLLTWQWVWIWFSYVLLLLLLLLCVCVCVCVKDGAAQRQSVGSVWCPVSTARQTSPSLTWLSVQIWLSYVLLLLLLLLLCVCV